MINLFVNSLILVFVYVIVFALYYATVVFMSSQKHKLDEINMPAPSNNNLIVIVYAHNNQKTLVPLLEQLNKQTYPKANYQVHIILDNCTDNSANMLEFVGGAKIWRLNEGAQVGKDEAVSWLLERLVSFQNVNAFVFLNANRIVSPEFLSSVNMALSRHDVIVGSTNLVSDKNTFKFKMLNCINKYRNYIFKTGRAVMGLATMIDSDAVVIKQEVLETIKCVDFKDVNGELKYTILLTKSGFTPVYNPNVKTWVDIKDFSFEKPELSYRFSLLRHCFPLMFNSNFKFAEFIFSMFTPNVFLLVFAYLVVALFSSCYVFFFDFYFVLAIGALFIGSLLWSVFVANSRSVTLKYLFPYPFYAFYVKHLREMWLFKLFRKDNDEESHNIERATVMVDVTDGKNVLPCKLEMISEDGLVKVVFRFKKKKYVTDCYIRMCDAIKSITDKLFQHGFRIKICQTCAFFSPKIDGTTNMIKGFCNRQEADSAVLEPEEKLLWNFCPYYLPQDLNKIVDINNYKKKNDK